MCIRDRYWVLADFLDAFGNLGADGVIQLLHVIDGFGKKFDLITHSISTSSASFRSVSEIPTFAIAS